MVMNTSAKPPASPSPTPAFPFSNGRHPDGRRTGFRARWVAAAKLALLSVTLVGLVISCTSDNEWLGFSGNTVGDGTLRSIPATTDVELVSVDNCQQLTDRMAPVIGAMAESMDRPRTEDGVATAESDSGGARASSEGMAADSAESAPAPGKTADERVVGTNVQEEGVDEADFVKADATRIVSVVNGTLRTVALDGTPQVDGTLALPRTQSVVEMYLLGDEVLLLENVYQDVYGPAKAEGREDRSIGDASMVPGFEGTRLTRVDISDLSAPELVESVVVEGSLAASRSIGDTVRVVIRGQQLLNEELSRARSSDEVRALADNVTSDVLLPQVVADDGTTGPLGGCRDVMVPTAVTSQSLPVNVTVLSINGSLADLHPVTVQGSADTVYASTDALVVAASGWSQNGSFTTLHRFDLRSGEQARPSGSGVVRGALLNQFAISERSGALRVVTTVDDPGAASIEPAGNATSASLTILDAGSETLAEMSRVDGLGPGESVQSVRFLDKLAYVVTFRQTDPLYAIDLSDPKAPRKLGELKVTGFSQYMHPIGDGLLVGVGREVDPSNGMDKGLKVSLFDVSDPAAMTEVDRLVIPNSYSSVGDDHRAFTWDDLNSQAILPVDGDCVEPGMGACAPKAVALVVGVSGRKLATTAELTHRLGQAQSTPRRSLIVGEDLWTFSDVAIGRSDAANPVSLELIPF